MSTKLPCSPLCGGGSSVVFDRINRWVSAPGGKVNFISPLNMEQRLVDEGLLRQSPSLHCL
eukprot:4275906-Prorocentrum_lima.AAC.1